MDRRSLIFLCFLITTSVLSAQEEQKPAIDIELFKHLNLSVTAGFMGMGVEASSPINDYVQMRAGVEYLPKFHKTVNFGVQVGKKKPEQTDEEYLKESQTKFEKLSVLLTSLTGQKVDDSVDMIGEPSFANFKFLVDVYPFKRDKRWHATAGFYWGSSRIIKAYNTTEDMPTLFSVNMYNDMYEKMTSGYYYEHGLLEGLLPPNVSADVEVLMMLEEKFSNFGRMGIHLGDFAHDIYAKEDILSINEETGEVLLENGEPVYLQRKGDLLHKAGDPYMMEPDGDCMVKANIRTNSFKPYLGFGYGTDMTKSKSGWGVSLDAGLLFWGGSPSIVTHDGVDLVNDLVDVRGKVGDYVDLIKGFKVYPVLQFKLTKRLF